MAYVSECTNGLTKWWVVGTGSVVNRLSEVMDDQSDGPYLNTGDVGAWTQTPATNEWYMTVTTRPDGTAAGQDVYDTANSAWLTNNDGNEGSLGAGEWAYSGASVLTVRLGDGSDPNSSDPLAYYDWSNFMTETFEDGVYLIHLPFEIGDGSTPTTLESVKETILFEAVDANLTLIKAAATFQMGELSGGYGVNGSHLMFKGTLSTHRYYYIEGIFLVYGSLVSSDVGDDYIYLSGSGNFTKQIYVDSKTYCLRGIRPFEGGASYKNDIQRSIFYSSQYAVYLGTTYLEDWDTVYCLGNFAINQEGTFNVYNMYITGNIISFASVGACILNFINALMTPKAPHTISHADSILTYQYTLNIHITDKDGEAIADTATVACTKANVVSNGGNYYKCIEAHTSGTFATDLAAGKWEQITDATIISAAPAWLTTTAYVSAESVFSVNPTDGSIAEQTVTVRSWTGTSELETKYIFDFSISETGYLTQTKDNVPITEAVDWRIALIKLNIAKINGVSVLDLDL